MDKLLGFVCALLCAWNADAQITAWTGKSITGTMTGTGTADFTANAVLPVISASAAAGTTLFTVTATATSPATIASYAFKTTTGNADGFGTITKDGTKGVVTLAKTVSYPTNKEVKFEVIAVDSATPTANTGTATITVKFGPSKYSSYSFCVADPTASGGTIGSLSSSVTTATWALSGTDFAIASGKITAVSKLEAHTQISYTATATLTDGSTSTTTYPVNVIIGNTCATTSGVALIVSSAAMVVLTILGIHVV